MNLIKIMAHDHEEAGIYNKNDAAVEHMLFSRKIAVTDPDYKNPLNGESPRVKLPKKASD